MGLIIGAQNIVSIGYVGGDEFSVRPFRASLAKLLLVLEHSASTLPAASGFECSPPYVPSFNECQGINLALLARAVAVRRLRKDCRVSNLRRAR
ncbi:hypothetical protein ACQ3JU_1135 (plasmid) [Bradyrhizobium guangxiense]